MSSVKPAVEEGLMIRTFGDSEWPADILEINRMVRAWEHMYWTVDSGFSCCPVMNCFITEEEAMLEDTSWVVEHLNDWHGWTFGEIADWLDKYTNQPRYRIWDDDGIPTITREYD